MGCPRTNSRRYDVSLLSEIARSRARVISDMAIGADAQVRSCV